MEQGRKEWDRMERDRMWGIGHRGVVSAAGTDCEAAAELPVPGINSSELMGSEEGGVPSAPPGA